MSDHLKEMIWVFGSVALTIALFLFFKDRECSGRAKMMGVNHEFGLITGCMIEYEKNKWAPIENVRKF